MFTLTTRKRRSKGAQHSQSMAPNSVTENKHGVTFEAPANQGKLICIVLPTAKQLINHKLKSLCFSPTACKITPWTNARAVCGRCFQPLNRKTIPAAPAGRGATTEQEDMVLKLSFRCSPQKYVDDEFRHPIISSNVKSLPLLQVGMEYKCMLLEL